MKTLSTVAMYGLVPFPPIHDAQAFGDNDDQPPTTDDANAALLAWYRHLTTKNEIRCDRLELEDLDGKVPGGKG